MSDALLPLILSMDWSDILSNLGIGALGSLVASVIFLYALQLMAPSVTISPKIALLSFQPAPEDSATSDPQIHFSVKVVNNSRFAAVNLQAEIVAIEKMVIDNRTVRIIREIPLRRKKILALTSKNDSTDPAGRYYSFFTDDFQEADIPGFFAQDANWHVLFRIKASHAFSGMSKVFSKEYTRNDLLEGTFTSDDSMEIVKASLVAMTPAPDIGSLETAPKTLQ